MVANLGWHHFFKMKKGSTNTIIGLIIVIFVIVAVLYFVSPGILNYGGRFIIDLDNDEVVFSSQDDFKSTLDVTIYPGGGHDNICYKGMVGYYVLNDVDEIVEEETITFFTTNHNADNKNRPMTFEGNINIDFSGYKEGEYSLIMNGYLSSIDDRPSCKYNVVWQRATTYASEIVSFESDAKLWFDSFEQDVGITKEAVKVKKFIIQNGNFDCNLFCRIKLWFSSLLQKIGF